MDVDILLEASKNTSTPQLPRCIFRVPEVLRRHNVLAYAPDIVSIGPYHPRNNVQFQAMENLKYEYLRDLLLHMDRSHDRDMELETSINKLINYIKDHKQVQYMAEFEKKARDFYAHPFDPLMKMEFLHMMILDGCFLVQIFRKSMDEDQRDTNDPLFNMDCMFQYICHDLLLLENQIPWFVLQDIYELTVKYYQTPQPSLSRLILTELSSQPQLSHNCKSYLHHLRRNDDNEDDSQPQPSHNCWWYLDHLRRNDDREDEIALHILDQEDESVLHILDLIRTSIVFSFTECYEDEKPSFNANTQSIASATALSEAGIRFKMSSDECKSIMNIECKNGVIMIPHLEIGELTESIFRNLIALEQCCYGRSHKITSYAVLMDNLLGSSNDIKFLCDMGIIGNWLSAENGSEFFSKLYCDTVLTYFYYDGLCTRVKKHQTKSRRWGETFARNYCSDPWKTTSWIAASILLILTGFQTGYTMAQYYSPRA
ncbi:UPF0481 protein At3g47200-like [Pyrus x bretschneideri]|uniref:UPF0481 protein At3g47200-like n=1 Tax=Pyrus x bretschneideri TaxID=225117 RepID=UPI00202F25D6|nr:UPF0481 protein At3g47200-like [Pyrus x bretschneideri]XP_048437730.1 UPF0481 protein At3g47200-like [Pyrus x bretschneideri]